LQFGKEKRVLRKKNLSVGEGKKKKCSCGTKKKTKKRATKKKGSRPSGSKICLAKGWGRKGQIMHGGRN